MRYAALPPIGPQRLTFYLAMEEYLARHTKGEWFFMWQVDPTVIFGRNQLIENEVNLPFCRARHIATYRRKSGGGCVYADRGNLMLSHVATGGSAEEVFRSYVERVAAALQALELPVSVSGRNDVLLDGRKVSGNAFYRIGNRHVLHGTLLYDTDMEQMVGSITPDSQKLLTKGVESVRQRIGLIKDYSPVSLPRLKRHLKDFMTDGETVLSTDDVREIRQIEKQYLSDDFIYGHNPAYTCVRRYYKPGCGSFEARMKVKNGILLRLNLLGDFFLLGDLDGELLRPLTGIRLNPEAVAQALRTLQPERVILNLQREDLVLLLTAQGKGSENEPMPAD